LPSKVIIDLFVLFQGKRSKIRTVEIISENADLVGVIFCSLNFDTKKHKRKREMQASLFFAFDIIILILHFPSFTINGPLT
ncbi:hypothetical protein, partial [Negativibacillus massiliensis]|uniref:hypothetical protein n=1 Tax=Negativibacillus massiliensis TaxID=1871035 RepID=UPI002A81913D